MIKLFAKKSKMIVASSAILFATAFQAGTCTVNIDQALLDQLSGLLDDFSFSGHFSSGGPQGGPHDGFDDNDDSDDVVTNTSSSGGLE